MHRIGILILAYYSLSSCNENREYCFCNKQKIQDSISTLQTNDLSVRIDSLKESKFYSLSKEESRVLWFNEIENPCKTEYTKLWVSSNKVYHTSQRDFIEFYNNRQDIELAFQLGPNGMMWSYHLFIVKKIGCCYLIIRTDNTHNHVLNKAYAIVEQKELEELYNIINSQQSYLLDTTFTFSYRGYFIDKRNKRNFYMDFENIQKESNPLVKLNRNESLDSFFNYIEDGIPWTETYSIAMDK